MNGKCLVLIGQQPQDQSQGGQAVSPFSVTLSGREEQGDEPCLSTAVTDLTTDSPAIRFCSLMRDRTQGWNAAGTCTRAQMGWEPSLRRRIPCLVQALPSFSRTLAAFRASVHSLLPPGLTEGALRCGVTPPGFACITLKQLLKKSLGY